MYARWDRAVEKSVFASFKKKMCPKLVLVPNRKVDILFLFFTIPRKENLFLMINVLHKFLFDTLYITEANFYKL